MGTWITKIHHLDCSRVVVAHVRLNKYGTHMDKQTTRADNAPDIDIANRIMNAMVVKGVNLKALADDTGISYSTLRRSLHQDRPDRRSFTFKEFHQISAALAVQPSTLLPDELAERAA